MNEWLDTIWKWIKRVTAVIVPVAAYFLVRQWRSPEPEEYRKAGDRKTRSASEAQREAEEREELEAEARDIEARAQGRVDALEDSDNENVDDPASYYTERRRMRDD